MNTNNIDFPALLLTLARQDQQLLDMHGMPWLHYGKEIPHRDYFNIWATPGVRNVSMMAKAPREEEVIRIIDGTTPGIYPVRESFWDSPAAVAAMQLNRSRQRKSFYYGFSVLADVMLAQHILKTVKDFENKPLEDINNPDWDTLKAQIESLAAPGQITVTITPIMDNKSDNSPVIGQQQFEEALADHTTEIARSANSMPEEDESGLEREIDESEDDVPGTEGSDLITIKLTQSKAVWDYMNGFQFQSEHYVENERQDGFDLELTEVDHDNFVTGILDEVGLDAFQFGILPLLLDK